MAGCDTHPYALIRNKYGHRDNSGNGARRTEPKVNGAIAEWYGRRADEGTEHRDDEKRRK